MENNAVIIDGLDKDLYKPTLGTKTEHTGKRSLVYSQWHRTLKNGTYCMDIDWIEKQKNPKTGKLEPYAVIEAKSIYGPKPSSFQIETIIDVADGLGLKYKKNVPAYIAYHNMEKYPNDWSKWVIELHNLKTNVVTMMTEPHYRHFIETLALERLHI